jgi:branched-chain amino acid transport system permease protein
MKIWLVRLFSVLVALGGVFLLQRVAEGALNDYEQRLVVLSGLYVTLAVSLNLINGITGQFSIGHAAFYQIGAYTAGFITLHCLQQDRFPGTLWLLGMIGIGALAASVAGFIVGLPSLRLKGDYLAIVTLGFGEIIRIIVQNIDELGGPYGLNVYPPGESKIHSIAFIWLLAIVCIAVFRNLLKTAHGLSFLATRDDEIASAAMGVNVTRVKVTAFVIGSAFAGAAGALLALYEGFITPNTFSMDVSFIILTMVMLGGMGSITGSVIAAAVLFYIPEWLREQPNVSGASFLAAVIATLFALVLILKIMKDSRATTMQRVALYLSTIAGAVFVKIGLTGVFELEPHLRAASYEGNQLRMVIFAATLIVVMLIRPQGVFANYEFSWEWLMSLLKRWKRPQVVNS